jgi:hypothetical protein
MSPSFALLAIACFSLNAEPKETPELNRKVLKFCLDNLGKKVGDGECATLAFVALEKTGGKRPTDLPMPKPPMKPDDSVWGRLLDADEEVLPGDIIQFRDVELRVDYPDKSWRVWFYPHHTAIVAEVREKRSFILIHQNVGNKDTPEERKRSVQLDALDLSAKTKGTVWIYRPLAK